MANMNKSNKSPAKSSIAKDALKRFVRNKSAMIGLAILLVVLFCICFANFIFPKELVTAYDVSARMSKPSAEHPFGTDNVGRDLLVRIVYGARVTVGIGVGATLASLLIGAAIAAVCAFSRKADIIIMRIMDVWNSIPAILLALVFLAVLGGSVGNMMFTLTVVSIPGFVRQIRAILFTVSEQDYVKAARLSGTKTVPLYIKHVFPNAIDTIIVNATMTVSSMMLSAAGLSAIGMGVAPPSPEWGAMLNYAIGYYHSAPYLLIFPGIAIVLTALSINLVGDGLRDALDPKSMK